MKCKLFLALLILAAIAGAVVSTVMVVMACRFMELGRVVFYLSLAIICAGLAIWGITNLISKKQ